MRDKKLLVVLGLVVVVLLGIAYAFRWEYTHIDEGRIAVRTNRWTDTTECFPSMSQSSPSLKWGSCMPKSP